MTTQPVPIHCPQHYSTYTNTAMSSLFHLLCSNRPDPAGGDTSGLTKPIGNQVTFRSTGWRRNGMTGCLSGMAYTLQRYSVRWIK